MVKLKSAEDSGYLPTADESVLMCVTGVVPFQNVQGPSADTTKHVEL